MGSADDLLTQLPTVFTYTEARQAGLSHRTLYSLRDRGEIELLARGLYLKQQEITEDPNLLEIAKRAPDATLCLASALARYGLSDEIPRRVEVAIPAGRWPPHTTAPVRWHRFDPATYDVGREKFVIGDQTMGIYSAERCICDAFRLRNREGSDQAITALQRWLATRGAQPSKLLEMAKQLGPRAEAPIQAALEVLL